MFVDYVVSATLVAVGAINIVPLAGVLSSEALAKAYGIEQPTGDVLVLLRHRAVLFGIIGGLIIVSAFVPNLQVASVAVAYISMVSFILLAGSVGKELSRVKKIDLVATLLLSVVPVVWLIRVFER